MSGQDSKQLTLTGETVVGDGVFDIGTPELNEKCARCGAERDLQIHHRKYVPEITTTLCRDCHKAVHSRPDSPYHPRQRPSDLFDRPSADSEAPADATVTVKRINENSYFYWNWRADGAVKSEYICAVSEYPPSAEVS